METMRGFTRSNILGLFIVLVMVSLQLIYVNSYPLGLEGSGLGIHQRQPSYLPDYNGIFSLHALNFTPAAIDKTEKFLQVLNEDNALISSSSNGSFDQLVTTNELPTTFGENLESNDQTTDRLNTETDGINEVDSDDTKVEVDSGNIKVEDNLQNDEEPATFPQIQVVTKTITEETFQPSTTTSEIAPTVKIETPQQELVPSTELTTLDESLKLTPSNNSETLLSGSEEDPLEADGGHDIFDHLMKTIQSHWLDFVGKMKLSVLDVWKSISQHMMDRLESFASAL